MQNFEELYILDEPIETRIGELHFLKVKEYSELMKHIPFLVLTKQEVLQNIKKEYLSKFDNIPFIYIIKYFNDNVYNLYQSFKDLFILCFKQDVFDKVETDEEFEYYRTLIIKMNKIQYKKTNPNPEIAYFQKLSQIVKERQGESITLKSMITNVGLYRHDVLDMSIYSLYAYFSTIATNKSFDVANLFKTVSTQPIEVKPWYADEIEKYTELNEEDKKYINSGMNFVSNVHPQQ